MSGSGTKTESHSDKEEFHKVALARFTEHEAGMRYELLTNQNERVMLLCARWHYQIDLFLERTI